METETIVIWSLVGFLIVWFLYGIIKTIIKMRKQMKTETEAYKFRDDSAAIFNDFKQMIANDIEMKDTYWATCAIHRVEIVYNLYSDENTDNLFESIEDKWNRYNNMYNDVKRIVNELTESLLVVKLEIMVNKKKWFTDESVLPNFFVLKCIGELQDDLYCYSTNLHFNTLKNNMDIVGFVYDNENADGRYLRISPYEYKIVPMNRNEFENNYLPCRLHRMGFRDARESVKYEKWLRGEFDKFAIKQAILNLIK